MASFANSQAMAQSPAVALRNLGLSPNSLMAAINQMDRMRPDIIPLLTLPSPRSLLCQSPPSEFTKFPELPMELRIKIWDHASFFQRNINIWLRTLGELRVKNYTPGSWTAAEDFESHEFVTNTEPPTLLHTCKESREVGLQRYRLSLGTSYEFSNVKISTPPQIYVNWSCDRICLLWPHQFGSHKSRCFKTFIKTCQDNSLRYLALNVLREQHWPYVDLTTMIYGLEEVLLFGSEARGLESYRDASNIGFIKMETLVAEHPEDWKEMQNHSWAIRLEIPRRDLITFFELNMHKLQESPDSPDTNSPEQGYELSKIWQPPRIVTGYITMNGRPERSAWDW
ncbi:hypothetical protein EG329_013131 [Mollisiaceae sp. DMI_Dod_QoI]|nr:hypothetical protein EG329_013131 [Helotiales sp. DMI_Dod_QoI]